MSPVVGADEMEPRAHVVIPCLVDPPNRRAAPRRVGPDMTLLAVTVAARPVNTIQMSQEVRSRTVQQMSRRRFLSLEAPQSAERDEASVRRTRPA